MGGLLGGSPTLANLGNDHGFISKEYIFIAMDFLGKPKVKSRELILKMDNIILLWKFVVLTLSNVMNH